MDGYYSRVLKADPLVRTGSPIRDAEDVRTTLLEFTANLYRAFGSCLSWHSFL